MSFLTLDLLKAWNQPCYAALFINQKHSNFIQRGENFHVFDSLTQRRRLL